MTESKYTRDEFVQREINLGIGEGEYAEDLDTDILQAIQKRAEWNAQAAERAGVKWRTQRRSKVVCRNCGNYEWPEKISDAGECRRCADRRIKKEEALKIIPSSDGVTATDTKVPCPFCSANVSPIVATEEQWREAGFIGLHTLEQRKTGYWASEAKEKNLKMSGMLGYMMDSKARPEIPKKPEVLWAVGESPGYYGYRITADGGIWNHYNDAGWVRQNAGWHPAMGELAKRLVADNEYADKVAKSGTEAWKRAHPGKYAYEEDDRGYEIAKEEFFSGFTYGYAAGSPPASIGTVEHDEDQHSQIPDWTTPRTSAPCPFCASKDLELNTLSQSGSGRSVLSIRCCDCQAKGPGVRESVEISAEARTRDIDGAWELWNRRVEEGGATELPNGSALPDALAAIDEINKQFDQEIDRRREIENRIGKIEERLNNRLHATTWMETTVKRVESEWQIQGQKYTADLRRVSHVNGELVKRVSELESAFGQMHLEFENVEGNLRSLLDSTTSAHDRLQLHDHRITGIEKGDLKDIWKFVYEHEARLDAMSNESLSKERESSAVQVSGEDSDD